MKPVISFFLVPQLNCSLLISNFSNKPEKRKILLPLHRIHPFKSTRYSWLLLDRYEVLH
ncbi:hypothetical protein SLEP1_g33849 [Rubroshorea leprosula]|uniref:Uncharacterized protein n=1 Tax=Rubroshorea leprosula TaxID=152421 RepID=A0AAV5KHX1_9ROSI|nr:hypothetical protein SLEP1_g33849 [Rubroshorea leprosula]